MKLFAIVLMLFAGFIWAEEAILVSVETVENSEGELYKVSPDGSSAELIFSLEGLPGMSSGYIKYIELSPDGQFIAFDSNHDHSYAPTNRNIFIIDSDVAGWMMVTPDNLAEDYGYSGPTGTVYGNVTCDGYIVTEAPVYCQGVPGEFITDGSGNYSISNVPPGSKFVYAYTMGPEWEIIWGYALVDVEAGEPNEAHIMNVGYNDPWGKDQYSNPKWSIDGEHIYSETFLTDGIEKTAIPGEWASDTIITFSEELALEGFDVHKSNGRIVYAKYEDGIYLMNPDGSERRCIFTHGSEGMHIDRITRPTWQPHGSKIAFRGYYEGDWTYWICVIDSSGGSIEGYISFTGYFITPYCWSPAGDYVLVGIYTSDLPDSVYMYKVNPYDPGSDYAYILGPALVIDADWGNLTSGIGSQLLVDNTLRVSAKVSPNPAEFASTIDFAMPQKGWARVEIYNLLGRQIRLWNHGNIDKGEHTVTWDGTTSGGARVPPGVYFCRITTQFGTGAVRITRAK